MMLGLGPWRGESGESTDIRRVMMMFGVRSVGRTDDTHRCEGQTAEQFPAKQPREKSVDVVKGQNQR